MTRLVRVWADDRVRKFSWEATSRQAAIAFGDAEINSIIVEFN
jgi:hypothetical protein